MGKQLNAESGGGTWAVLVQPLELSCGGAEWAMYCRESAELGDGWEIGEDTREPLEGRFQQDSINNLVFVPVKYDGKAAWTIKLESV